MLTRKLVTMLRHQASLQAKLLAALLNVARCHTLAAHSQHDLGPATQQAQLISARMHKQVAVRCMQVQRCSGTALAAMPSMLSATPGHACVFPTKQSSGIVFKAQRAVASDVQLCTRLVRTCCCLVLEERWYRAEAVSICPF
jgi:hypothetical protein